MEVLSELSPGPINRLPPSLLEKSVDQEGWVDWFCLWSYLTPELSANPDLGCPRV